MPEWLLERGIGETRAALVEDGRMLEARVERPGGAPALGDIWFARLTRITAAGRGFLALGGSEGIAEQASGFAEGSLLRVEVVREAIPERGRPRLAKLRILEGGQGEPGRLSAGPGLEDRLARTGHAVRVLSPVGGDRLEEAGWSEVLDQARSGLVPFPGGLITISPTPAMTLIDVDGDLPPAELALAGTRAAVAAIRLFGIGGSIGIDLPTAGSKEVRQRCAAAIDEALPQPFERTAVNGFGFVQIVRPRPRASLVELAQNDPAEFAALLLLRQAERTPGAGPRTLAAHPQVTAWLAARQDLLEVLKRRLGADAVLKTDPSLPLWGAHVTASQN
jgi:hypothetical protein